jgi:hypothetical protein
MEGLELLPPPLFSKKHVSFFVKFDSIIMTIRSAYATITFSHPHILEAMVEEVVSFVSDEAGMPMTWITDEGVAYSGGKRMHIMW